MNLKTKRRLGAFLGYPLALFALFAQKGEEAKKENREYLEIFKARILGKKLD